jgi:predicted lipoprotein with Yx(FWY)xxD motif
MNRALCALCLLFVLAGIVSGCGGSDGDDSTAPESAPPSTSTTAADEREASNDKPEKAIHGVAFGARSANLGIILFDFDGRTLYTFGKDQNGKSSCYGACAKRWPPALTEGKPLAQGEASAAKLRATKRRDGGVQLVYAGHPLYYYSGDKGGAEYNGQGVRDFGSQWYVIRPSGQIVGS